MRFYWVDCNSCHSPDTVAFRLAFNIALQDTVSIRVFGASWFNAWLDGEYFTEGPYRFDPAHPQYEEREVFLAAGEHVLAAEVRSDDFDTRILKKMPPFFGAEFFAGGKRIPFRIKSLRLGGIYLNRRINPQLGYSEERDMKLLPDFRQIAFDDGEWGAPCEVFPCAGELSRVDMGAVRRTEVKACEIGRGALCENFGYVGDDKPVRFFLRDLCDKEHCKEGIWLRYDLEKVRLMHWEASVKASVGAVMETAYSETLQSGRVSPWITLSGGTSCNMDRYILKNGENRISSFVPHGGRYFEIHLLGVHDFSDVNIEFYERGYFDAPIGRFDCGDKLLTRIWNAGVETFRSCTEDAVIDNPTRERGEWTGDVVSVGMNICAAAYDDMRIIRRGLMHAAWCAAADGCVAGLCPGGVEHVSTYALQWVTACVEYYRITGDRALLEELFEYAERNIEYFESNFGADGLGRNMHWSFIDWGYVSDDEESDMAVNLHFYSALAAYIEWSKILKNTVQAEHAEKLASDVRAVIKRYLDGVKGDWEKIGLHRAVLALGENFFCGREAQDCVEFIKRHYLRCFPNNPDAPRLGAPDKADSRLITPYFSHYALRALWEAGEGDFVLDQYRKCWGWLVGQDNTLCEVFDTRWSHCHEWSGCPTWQLSRYVLGLKPRFDIGEFCYEYSRKPCSQDSAEGIIPIAGGGKIYVKLLGGKTEYRSTCAVSILKDGVVYELEPEKAVVL